MRIDQALDDRIAHLHGIGIGRVHFIRGIALADGNDAETRQFAGVGFVEQLADLVNGRGVLELELVLVPEVKSMLSISPALAYLVNSHMPKPMPRMLKVMKNGASFIQSMLGRRSLSHSGNFSGRLLILRRPKSSMSVSRMVRVQNSEVKRLATIPMISVMPKPLTSSVPNQMRKTEVMTWSCWSREWRTGPCRGRCGGPFRWTGRDAVLRGAARRSARCASTAVPMLSTMPAMLGRVNVASSPDMTARISGDVEHDGEGRDEPARK